MIKPTMWRGATMIALSAALAAGCDDETSPVSAPGVPSLRVLGDNPACDRVFLPTVQPAELRDEAFRTMVVTVNGRDPANASGVIDGNTAVTFEQEPQDGMGSVAFLSSYTLARTGGLDRLMALQQAGQSSGREFAGGVAADQIICVTPGSVRIRARVESYNDIGEIVSADVQSFVVACQSPAQYDEVCAPPPDDEDMAVEDMGVMDGEVVDEDDGVEADAEVDDPPSLWSINFEPIENEAGENARYVIGIRNAGLGRRDNIALQFKVSELGAPLENIPVKFVLSTITQPEVTISTGGGARFEAEGTSITTTGSEGVAEVRVIAGDTPGLAVVRAVAMRLPANTDDRAQLFDDAGCVDDGGEGLDCMFNEYCRDTVNERAGGRNEELCEVDRSSQVVIVGGIPSGRGLQLQCTDRVVPAFISRRDDEWSTINQLGTDCRLQVADRVNGRVGEGTQIFFLTEAGTVDQVATTDDNGGATTHLRVGDPPPVDVEPDDIELEAGYLPGGYNPRDGLVRVVAVTKGEEDFTDVNGDKIYTPGEDLIEPGQDLPEPYIDSNDNGRWEPGEEFRDANNDGVWTDINGEWDSNTEIWTSTNVLWVGEYYNCRTPGRRHEDCGCAPIDGREPADDCRENVGGVPRNEPPASLRCLNDQCSTEVISCPRSAAQLTPGGLARFTAHFTDINGNCIWANDGEFTVGNLEAVDGYRILGTTADDLGDHDCFSAFEQPSARPISVDLIYQGASEGGEQDIGDAQPFENITILNMSYRLPGGVQRNFVVTANVCAVP